MTAEMEKLLNKELRDWWNNFSLRRKVWIRRGRPETGRPKGETDNANS
jgi:hypothetical protein